MFIAVERATGKPLFVVLPLDDGCERRALLASRRREKVQDVVEDLCCEDWPRCIQIQSVADVVVPILIRQGGGQYWYEGGASCEPAESIVR